MADISQSFRLSAKIYQSEEQSMKHDTKMLLKVCIPQRYFQSIKQIKISSDSNNVQNINCRLSTKCDVTSWVSLFIEYKTEHRSVIIGSNSITFCIQIYYMTRCVEKQGSSIAPRLLTSFL